MTGKPDTTAPFTTCVRPVNLWLIIAKGKMYPEFLVRVEFKQFCVTLSSRFVCKWLQSITVNKIDLELNETCTCQTGGNPCRSCTQSKYSTRVVIQERNGKTGKDGALPLQESNRVEKQWGSLSWTRRLLAQHGCRCGTQPWLTKCCSCSCTNTHTYGSLMHRWNSWSYAL